MSHSKPIQIKTNLRNHVDRSLSEQFEEASPNTQSNVLMYTNGVKPTSKYKAFTRVRSDSIQLSPATESVLLFHGIVLKK